MNRRDEKVVREVSLRQLFEANLVIPEIQREYVWGDPEIGKRVLEPFYEDFLKSVQEYANKREQVAARTKSLSEHLQKSLDEFGIFDVGNARLNDFSNSVLQDVDLAKGEKVDSKVGFVYAYVPGFAKGVRENVLAFLIDGQQRVTTFFLLWLYLARRTERIDDFAKAVRLCDVGMAFDFKVRPLTHDFLSKLVNHVVDDKEFDFSSIEECVWFLSEYRNDVSISSMSNALRVWDKLWARSGQDAAVAYDYLTDHIKFWLFVMNEASQGEQLYITMNGRGKSLSEDEIIRAKVFRDAIENEIKATEVGEVFESVEDFFWTHRITGELTADKGKRKFFRWVYLLDRYGKPRVVNDDKVEVDEFAEGLRQDRKFELVETMVGRDEKTGEARITFGLIKNTLAALKQIFGNDCSDVCNYLRESILGKADDDQTFQLDCVVLLPLLAWMSAMNKEGRIVNADEAARFARYLRKLTTKSDVGHSPATAVPNALGLAVAFAESQKDFLTFLSESGSGRFAQGVLPDEERGKANRLLSIRSDQPLYFDFVKFLDEIENYKSEADNGDKFSADYRISAFLQLSDQPWYSCVWDGALLKSYKKSFDRIKSFWKRDPLRRLRFLMTPEFGGYYETNKKLWPYSRSEIMGDLGKLRKIIAFEQRVEAVGEQKAFDESEQDYLNKHWNTLGTESDVRTLCALGLIVQCRLGKAIESDWVQKIQFEESYYEGKTNVVNPQGVFPMGKYYFWFQGAKAGKWLYSAAKKERLFHANQVGLNDLTAQLNVQTAVSPMVVPPVK